MKRFRVTFKDPVFSKLTVVWDISGPSYEEARDSADGNLAVMFHIGDVLSVRELS